MSEGFRVLVSCRQAWDGLDQFREMFNRHRILVDIPDVPGQALAEADLLSMIVDYDGILAGDDELTRRVIEAAPKLKVISKWGVGVDAIDQEAAAERGVIVLNTPGVFGDELADYALGFILLIARSQHLVDRAVRMGDWMKPRGHSLAGRVLGIVGLGSSGSKLADRAAAMGMRVLGSDPFVKSEHVSPRVELVVFDELLSSSDVISLHLPLTVESRSIIDSEAISSTKHGVWIVNTSRGALVDEDALLTGLQSGQIGAAALDVFQNEPVAPGHPLLAHPHVIAGSHNGSNTYEAVERTTVRAVENLIEGLLRSTDL